MAANRFRDLRLSARVLRGEPGMIVSQVELIEMLDATDRTLRDWSKRGMPTIRTGPGKPPRYNTADVLAWTARYHHLCGTDRAPHHLSVEEAVAHVLRGEMDMDPRNFTICPLEWDHPRRAAQLELAAAGLEPPTGDDEAA
jgi:phage terminase Nu1 subunit (DNA packaging protein)